MTALALVRRLQEQGVELGVDGDRIRFRAPQGTLSEVDRATLSAQRDEIVRLLREEGAARRERLPLSSGQQSILLLDRLTNGAPVNNLAAAVLIRAAPDRAATTAALQRLLDRHPMTRATFHLEGDALVQHVAGAARADVGLTEAAGLDDAALRRAVELEHERPFDLQAGPLLRVVLFDRGPAGHVLLLSAHHIVSDALSIMVLFGELLRCWSEARGGPPAGLPPLEGSYAEFIAAEAAFLAGPDGARLGDHWRDQLAELPPPLPLPADRSRAGLPAFRGGTVPFSFSPAATEGLAALSRSCNATLFTVTLASWSSFLARATGRADMVIGTPLSIRANEASYRVVGDFVNALPIRLRLRWGEDFRGAIARHRPVVLDALEAGRYPIQQVINGLGTGRSASAAPLFNVFFNFQQLHVLRDLASLASGLGDGMDLDGTGLEPFRLPQQLGQFDLALNLSRFGGAAMSGSLDYASDLFDAGTAERLAQEYTHFVEALVANPGMTLLPPGERARLLGFNDTDAALPAEPLPEQFRAAARRTPGRVAVRADGATLDYAALDARSDALARRLRQEGVGRGSVVGLLLDRSVLLPVALLAVAKAGAAFLPLDPAFPPARLAHMVGDSGAALLVSDAARPAWAPETVAVIDPQATPGPGEAAWDGPDPEDTAYLLYTSGSTGTPNGVAVSHGALSNLLGAMLREPGFADTDVVAAVTTISFDIALLELFAPLLAGAAVEIFSQPVARDGARLRAALDGSAATVMQATPASWRMLVEAGWQPRPGFRALSGGEALPADLAERLLRLPVELWNLYGPTETTIYSTGGRVTDPARIDVGRPIANTRVYVVDDADDLVPIGVTGRVWIGGAGVAQGYRGQPERTARRFRTDPFAPGRVYDTGDLGRWTPDGRLALAGRSDDQIKLRGFRIEPGEVEAALATDEDVAQAVVAARAVGDDIRLVAYVVPAGGAAPTSSELRRHARAVLPDYMVPAMFVTVAAMPLTPNGKVDRRRLPDPFLQNGAGGGGRAPRPGMEQRLAQIWEATLEGPRVGADDKFFEIGGHSLLALRVAAQVEKQTGRRLAPTALFFQTLSEIAASLSPDR